MSFIDKTTRVVLGMDLTKSDLNMRVGDFILNNGKWDLDLLRRYFLGLDVDIIENIPLSLRPNPDQWVWHFDPKGVFSVHSAYKLAYDEEFNMKQADNSRYTGWWKKIWNLCVPNKIKIFMWRAFYETLPTYENLIRRGFQLDSKCPRCGNENETQFHALITCPASLAVWDLHHLPLEVYNQKNIHFANVCLHLALSLSRTDFEFFATLCWYIWRERNYAVFGGKCLTAASFIDCSSSMLCEFQALHKKSDKTVHDQIGKKIYSHCPPSSSIKLNVDAAIQGTKVGLGGVFQNAEGVVLGIFGEKIDGCTSVAVGEAMAIRAGPLAARAHGLDKLIIEFDAKIVVDAISKPPLSNDLGTITYDIRSLSDEFCDISFSFVSRDCNSVAHALATKDFSFKFNGLLF